MKSKDIFGIAILGLIGFIVYKMFAKPSTTTTPATASTGTAGLASLLFGSPKNGSATATNSFNPTALANAGGSFVKDIASLFNSSGGTKTGSTSAATSNAVDASIQQYNDSLGGTVDLTDPFNAASLRGKVLKGRVKR